MLDARGGGLCRAGGARAHAQGACQQPLQLRACPHPNTCCWQLLLLTRLRVTAQVSRETFAQIMFETFNVNGLYASEQPILALYGVGKLTGLSVDIGAEKIGARRRGRCRCCPSPTRPEIHAQ